MEVNTGQEKDESTIMAFRLSSKKRQELLGRAKPNETKSLLLRRVVDTFLRVTRKH